MESENSLESVESVAQCLRMGLDRHRDGDLLAAEACYQRILKLDASHADALNLLGVLARGRGELDRSEELIRRAIAREPSVATYQHSLGRSYALRGDKQAAARCFRTAVTLNPSDVDSMQVLGGLLAAEGEVSEAMAWYGHAVALAPHLADVHFALTELLKSAGDQAGALQCARRAAAEVPEHFGVQFQLASLLIEAGFREEALAPLQKAIQLRPGEHNPYHCLGTLLHELGYLDEAKEAYSQALRIQPDFIDSLSNLGALLKDQGDLRSSEVLLRKVIEIQPGFLNARCNLGSLLEKQGDPLAAVECFQAVLLIDPKHVPTLCNLGLTLDNLGDEEGAVLCYRLALQQDPNHALCRFNLSLHHLADADFTAGWREYEQRWFTPPFVRKRPRLEAKLWQGEPLGGGRILLYAEQGLGDTLQFYRYAPMVAALGAEVVLQVQPELVRLLRDRDPLITVLANGPVPAGRFEWQCPLLSLPRAFETELATIPAAIPYLSSRRGTNERGVNSFAQKALRVGLVWSGSPQHTRDLARSLPISSLEKVLRVPGVQFFSLQKGVSAAQLQQLSPELRPLDLGPSIQDFTDTAAMLDDLDLLLTVDTSVAHLAGAMGMPVWIMLPHVADWRWLKGRSHNPWYPNARLFRQHRPGDWSLLLADVQSELEKLVQVAAASQFPLPVPADLTESELRLKGTQAAA